MSITTLGIVKNGVVVPNVPLPEGAWVEIHANGEPPDVPSELRDELAGWQQAGADALSLVERLTHEHDSHETR